MTGPRTVEFRPAHAPGVTVVIPTTNSATSLARVLPALARELDRFPAEVLLLLDRPTDEVREVVDPVRGARRLESAQRLGLPAQLHLGRREARSRRLLVLHDDAIPEPGWLEGLLAAAAAAPDAAILGSLQLAADGSPLRGGSLVWPEGFTTPEPLDAAPLDATPIRTVDYVGTASMLIDLETFDAFGGADPRFHPAYFVDVDLCFAARALGRRVALVPSSRVVHFESRSSTGLFKEFLLLRNRDIFVEKWGERLRRRPAYRPDEAARRELIARVDEEEREGAAGTVRAPAPAPSESPASRHRAVLIEYLEWLETRRPENGTPGLGEEVARVRAELSDSD